MILKISTLAGILKYLYLIVNFSNGEYLGGEVTSCGSNTLPYLLTVDSTGHPELFCDLPACFDWTDKKEKASHLFSNNNNKIDDYNEEIFYDSVAYEDNKTENKKNSFNKNSLQRHRRNVTYTKEEVARNLDASSNELNRNKRNEPVEQNFAQCTKRLTEAACSAPNDWTGSVAEWNNGTHISLRMECCRFDGLNNAIELKTVVLQPGQQYRGGVVNENGKSVAFDLIKEVRKNVTDENEVKYVIKVYRMICTSNQKSKVDAFYEQNKEINQNNRLQPSASMLRIAMSKKRSQTETYLQKIRMATAASKQPKFNHFSHLAQQHKMRYELPSERRRHPSIKQMLAERENEIPGNADSRKRHSILNKHTKFFLSRPTNRQQTNNLPSFSNQDEYLYYDINDESTTPNRQPQPLSYKRHQQLKSLNEQLWPIRLSPLAPQKSKLRKKSRLFAANEAFNNENFNSLDEDYQILESTSLPTPLAPIEQQIGGGPFNHQDNHSHEQSVFYEHVTPAIHYSVSAVQEGYPALNSYIPPPPSAESPTQLLSASNTYETAGANYYPNSVQNYQHQYNTEPQQQQCSTSCATQQTGCGSAPQTCCCGSNLNSAFSSLQCFSGDMKVQTRDGGLKRMDQLQIGDFVLSIDQSLITYSPIVMFLHRKPIEPAFYRNVRTVNGQNLKITDYHLIYTSKCKNTNSIRLVQARKLEVGDCIYIVPMSKDSKTNHLPLKPSQIVEIKRIEESGIYAPLTANGNIVVNEVLASCHSNVAAQTLQQTFFGWWRSINSWTSLIFSMFKIEKQFNAVAMLFKSYTTEIPINSISCLKSDQHLSHLSNNVTKFLSNVKTCQSIEKNVGTSFHEIETRLLPSSNNEMNKEIPFGVEYITQVLDLIVPMSAF